MSPLELWCPLVEAAMPDALLIHDHAGRLLDVNQRACDRLGYAKADLLALTVAAIEQDFDLACAQATWTAMPPGSTATRRSQQRRCDGSVFPVEINVGVLVTRERRLYLAVVRDLTEQSALAAELAAAAQALDESSQQARAELARQLASAERRYHAMVESMAEGSVLHGADGRIVACNAAAERILGLSADQLLQRTSFDARWAAVHADGSPCEGAEHPAMVTLRTGRPVYRQLLGVDDGRSARRWLSVTAVPLRLTAEVGHDAVLVTFEDVSERLRYQQEAEALLRRQRRIMDSALFGALITLDHQCIWANGRAARLLGYPLEALVGCPVRILFPDTASYATLEARAYPVLHRGELFRADVQLLRCDGQPARYALTALLLDPASSEALWTITDSSVS